MEREFPILKERIKPLIIPEDFRSINHYQDLIRFYKRTIKVVVDTAVEITETGEFGVGRFIKLLRETSVGCTRFSVDIAVRPFVAGPADISFEENPAPIPSTPHRYLDFRFDSQLNNQYVSNRYHEVFLFGFAPDNSNGPDSNISDHPWYATDAELEVLHAWMNQGGGVFVTGDHDYLGASMCSRIPRVGTMRKWTNADGVLPIGGVDRIDTNRPATPGQENGTDTILNDVEEDALPQFIEWVPEQVIQIGLKTKKRPHLGLCHPKHGPINVMSDHPHEGCCVEPANIN